MCVCLCVCVLSIPLRPLIDVTVAFIGDIKNKINKEESVKRLYTLSKMTVQSLSDYCSKFKLTIEVTV